MTSTVKQFTHVFVNQTESLVSSTLEKIQVPPFMGHQPVTVRLPLCSSAHNEYCVIGKCLLDTDRTQM